MAAPTIDGTPATGTFSTASSGTVTLTTPSTNDVIVVVVHCEKNSARQTVSSVTATGLTFVRRSQFQYDGGTPSTALSNVEVWWAPAAAALTAKVITINLSAATDDASIVAFGVNGCFDITSPWDSNVGLPKNNSTQLGTTQIKPPATTTTQSNDLILDYMTTVTNGNFSSSGGLYTLVATATNAGGVNRSLTSVWSRGVTSPLSGSIPDGQVATGASTAGASASADALTADPVGTTYNVSMSEAGSAADTLAASATFASTVAETTSSADTVSQTTTYSSSVAETTTATDTVVTNGTFGNSVVEAATALDTLSSLDSDEDGVVETASALDIVSLAGLTIPVYVQEAVSARDTTLSSTASANTVSENVLARDTQSCVVLGRTWFLSFAHVVPPPEGEGPGNTGKLFGDFRLEPIPPNARRRR